MFEYLLISISLLAFTSLMWATLIIGKSKIVHTNLPKILVDLLFFVAHIKIIFYYALPLILRTISGFQFEKEDGILPVELINVYAIESISLLIYISAICLITKLFFPNNKTLRNYNLLSHNIAFAKYILILISIGFIYFLASTIIKFSGENDLAYEIFKSGLFFYCGVSVGPLMMILSGRYLTRKYFYIGILLSFLTIATISTRGSLIYLLLFFYFLVWYVIPDRKSKIILLFTTSFISTIFFIFGGIPKIAISIGDQGLIQIETGTSSDKNEGRTVIQEIEWRFGAATRMGTKFFVMYDRGDAAGLLPIKHSLQSGLPRFISPDKPIPSTLDPADIYTQGMYLISRETHGYDSYSMVEFPTGGHYYWELGYFGIFLFSILAGIYTVFCVVFFKRFGFMSISLTLAIMKPWGYMEPKIWVSDAIIQIYQIIIPAGIIYFGYIYFLKTKNGIISYVAHSKN